jgi:hypothetical protein
MPITISRLDSIKGLLNSTITFKYYYCAALLLDGVARH